MASGEIAEALNLKANTCSVHLSHLARAGLIAATRSGTHVRYAVVIDNVSDLMQGVFRNCCNNRPDLCLHPRQEGKTMTDKPFNVLFICTGNSARSIMAEAILNAEGKGLFQAYSAGTKPAGAPHPQVLEMLSLKGLDESLFSSKSTDIFAGDDAPKMDFVFTVCDHAANEECPVWPGQPMTAHWGVADPTKVEGTQSVKALAFQQTYGLLRNRISAFISLPIATLDRISLQHAVDEIGRQKETA